MEEAERRARRQRRREMRLQRLDDTVPSPCQMICQVNSASTPFIGCLRTLEEIRDWPIMTAEEKRRLLKTLEERRAAEREKGVP